MFELYKYCKHVPEKDQVRIQFNLWLHELLFLKRVSLKSIINANCVTL